MTYHPEIDSLDQQAIALYAAGRKKEATQLQLKAGALQQQLIRTPGKRYLSPQWVWAYGHIGLLGMLIRSMRGVELVLETRGSIANPYFLETMAPFLTVVERLPVHLEREAQDNAVYFACPDGVLSIHNFYKRVAREYPEPILGPAPDVSALLERLGVRRPYVAVHARNFGHDPWRNVSRQQVEDVLQGANAISIGIDGHPINDLLPNVQKLPNPWLASFQLSAACDRFIGCNSGAWTVANAYGRPVELINDHEHKAWIYPEDIEE